MTGLQIIIPGDPVAKGRPRAAVIRGQARMYTPAKTARYESKVALFAQQAMRGAQRTLPLDVALSVHVQAYLPIPTSWSQRKQRAALAGEIRPVSRPDADNIGKAVTDGCNGIVWRDDSLIVDWRVTKTYALDPRVLVAVTLLEPEGVQPALLAEAQPETEECAFP